MVEDDQKNLKLFRALLEILPDCEINTEERGWIALKKIKSLSPDLIILDIQLPEMSGIKICQELRKLDKFKTTPINAVTTFALKGDMEQILMMDFNEYISKPKKITKFRNFDQEYLQKEGKSV